MERSIRGKKILDLVNSFKWLLCLGTGVFAAVPTDAGILLAAPPAHSAPQPEEEFPDSKFGSPPIRSESVDQDRESGNRKPAGLEFTDQTGQVKSTPVIQETDTPNSIANMNPKPTSASRAGVQEVALIAGDLGFFPRTLFVTRDIPVRLYVTGASKKSLCVMMDFFQIRRQVRSQKVEEINFTPSAAGQFRFYCPINGMEGTLLVKEISTISTTSKNGATLGTAVGMSGSNSGD